jgi:hypothetical protein
MSEIQPRSDEEARAFVAGGLMVTECGPVSLESAPTTAVPLVVVDPTNRPDLLDLGRVFIQEQPGGGEAHTTWDLLAYDAGGADTAGDLPRGYVSLTITTSRPVASSLKILFALPRWIDELERIEVAPKLVIALGPPGPDGNWDPLKVITLGSPGSHAHEVIRDAVELVESWGEEDVVST